MQRIGKREHAFLLVELVCVIIILVLLACLLFPLFAQTFDKARNTPCLANMHQVGTALQLYMHDYDFVFPVLDQEAASKAGDTWGEGFCGHWSNWDATRRDYQRQHSIGALLERYSCDAGTWVCPSDHGADKTGALGRRWSSYHYRLYLTAGFAPGYANAPLRKTDYRELDFDNPTRSYVLNELWTWHGDQRADLDWLPKDTRQGWDPKARIRLVFLDGHVAVKRVDQCLMRSPSWTGQGFDYHWPRTDKGLIDCE